jgi:hypothetical protein
MVGWEFVQSAIKEERYLGLRSVPEALEIFWFKDPPAKVAPIRNEKGVISQSFWYL